MYLKPDREALRLLPIPTNIVVHTPTEAEAKELLAILHENGYKWGDGDSLKSNLSESDFEFTYILTPYPTVFKTPYRTGAMPFAEFKERYVDFDDTFTDDCKSPVKDEQPQPKFKVGDKVRFEYSKDFYSRMCEIKDIRTENGIAEYQIGSVWAKEPFLEPYTEAETKEETMETKELNLCELLAGREKETFYSPYIGTCHIIIPKGESSHPLRLQKDDGTYVLLPVNGQESDGHCMLYPSRALYEQYPLDPYTAWMKWQEEQTQYKVNLMLDAKPECPFSSEADSYEFAFPTSADRDKFISEIKAIIEKYSKK